MTTLEVVLSFLIGLAANGTTSAVVEQRQCSLDEVLQTKICFGKRFLSNVRSATKCVQLASNWRRTVLVFTSASKKNPMAADGR